MLHKILRLAQHFLGRMAERVLAVLRRFTVYTYPITALLSHVLTMYTPIATLLGPVKHCWVVL